MKKTVKKVLGIMLAFAMLLTAAVPAFSADGEITVSAPVRVTAPKGDDTVLKIPYVAELNGSTNGFVKTATDADGNAFDEDEVWFDDGYMYYTNVVNPSVNSGTTVRVTSSKDGLSQESIIYVEPYIYEDFESYASGTGLNTGNDPSTYTEGNVTPETTGYYWTSGYSVKNSVLSNSTDGTVYLSTAGTGANWSSRIDMNPRIVADYRDVTIELDLYLANQYADYPVILKGSDEQTGASYTEYLMYLAKNETTGMMELYSDAGKASVLKAGIAGTTANIRIAAHMDRHLYDVYVNGEKVVTNAVLNLNKINQILFSYHLEGFEIYSGEKAEKKANPLSINAPSDIILSADTQKTFRIPFTAEIGGTTDGIRKVAVDNNGNAVKSVWFDDGYMYYDGSIGNLPELNVICSVDTFENSCKINIIPAISVDYTQFDVGSKPSEVYSAPQHYALNESGDAVITEKDGYRYLLGKDTLNTGKLTLADTIDSGYKCFSIEYNVAKFAKPSSGNVYVPGVSVNDGAQEITRFYYKGSNNFAVHDAANSQINDYIRFLNTTSYTANKAFVNVKMDFSYNESGTLVYDIATSAAGGSGVHTGIPVGDVSSISDIVFASCIQNISICSGEEVSVLDYVINDEFSSWQDGVKYFAGSSASNPSGVNNIVVNTGDENTAYFGKATVDGRDMLESYFEATETQNTQNVRYSGAGIGSKFMVEYNIFIESNGIRAGISGAPDTTAGSPDYWPEMFYFETDGKFRSDLLSGDSYLGSYRTGEWNNAQLIADTQTGEYSVYLNGYPVIENAYNEQLMGYVFSTVRHNIIMRSQNGNAHRSYLDYFRVANVGEGFNIEACKTDITVENAIVLNQEILIGANSIDAADLIESVKATGKDAYITNASGEKVESGTLAHGYKVYVTSENGNNICCYNVSAKDISLYLGRAVNTTVTDETTAYDYDVTLHITRFPGVEFEGCVIVAEYDETDALVGIARENVVADEKITVNYVPESVENTVRAFAWNSIEDITPLTKSIGIQ